MFSRNLVLADSTGQSIVKLAIAQLKPGLGELWVHRDNRREKLERGQAFLQAAHAQSSCFLEIGPPLVRRSEDSLK
jgi:hypothetical protein